MPRPRPTSAPGRFVKPLVLCLLLGAALQYAVAAAFGLAPSSPQVGEKWGLRVLQGSTSARVQIQASSSFGKDVLEAVFWYVTEAQGKEMTIPTPDYGRAEWFSDASMDESNNAPPAMTLCGAPLNWSRLAGLRTAPIIDDSSGAASIATCVEVGCGWPIRSASYFRIEPMGASSRREIDGLLVVTPTMPTAPTGVLPLTLYWPGALANTLIYAAALLVPFTMYPIVRRHLRRRRGRCPACSYDLRATTTGICPECGAAIGAGSDKARLT